MTKSQWIVRELHGIQEMAKHSQTCKRKAVGCYSMEFSASGLRRIGIGLNGPSVRGHVCSNEVGNCGCAHAEPRCILSHIGKIGNMVRGKAVLVCEYSPCTNCANLIIDSGLFSGVIYRTLTTTDFRGVLLLQNAMENRVVTVDELRILDETCTNEAQVEAAAHVRRCMEQWSK